MAPDVLVIAWRTMILAVLVYTLLAYFAVYRFLQPVSRRLMIGLVATEVLMLVAHLVWSKDITSFWEWFVNLDFEDNLGSMFAAGQYLLAAGLAVINGFVIQGLKTSQRVFWGLMAGLLLWLSIDEFFALHEAIATWQTYYILGGMVTVIFCGVMFFSAYRSRFELFVPLLFGLVVMAAGGVVFDAVTNDAPLTFSAINLIIEVNKMLGCESFVFVGLNDCNDIYLFGFVEEFFELAGVTAVVVAFANHTELQFKQKAKKIIGWASAVAFSIWLVIMALLLWVSPTVAAGLQAEPANIAYLEDKLILHSYQLSAQQLHPGEEFSVSLYFQVSEPAARNYTLSLHLLEQDDAGSVAQTDIEMGEWRYPLRAWVPGINVRNRAIIHLPDDLQTPRSFWLTVRVWDRKGVEDVTLSQVDRLQIDDSTFVLTTLPILSPSDPPIPPETAQYTFVDGMVLSGYHMPQSARPGETLTPAFWWRTSRSIDLRLNQFLHLIQQDGDGVYTFDQEPFGSGQFPTSDWPAGMYERARWQFSLPDDLPPGTYNLYTGLYTPEDVARRAVTDASEQLVPDNAVPLGQIIIEHP